VPEVPGQDRLSEIEAGCALPSFASASMSIGFDTIGTTDLLLMAESSGVRYSGSAFVIFED
jgi:hypothetical protein